MRAVVQRVRRAAVRVEGATVGEIGAGLCALVGVTHGDSPPSAEKMADKLWNLRIFPDDAGQMNRSAAMDELAILVVSQFTLYGDTSRGRRPSFASAAPPAEAEPLYEHLVAALRALGAEVHTGRFGAHMEIELVNDGPVTLLVET